MKPATWPRDVPDDERLLVLDPATGDLDDTLVRALPSLLRRGDLLVVNDAATLPGSLFGHAEAAPVEVRLAGERLDGSFVAVLFGAPAGSDWRTPTEHRPWPPRLMAGASLHFHGELTATIEAVDPRSPRLVRLRFATAGAPLWSALYRAGRPVQYAYLDAPLELWHVQTVYAGRPCAAEQPSAGRPIGFGTMVELRRRGVGIERVTHAAGLSSTGDSAIDAALPLPERFDIPEATVAAVAATRASGARVVAVGTSVVRALEGAAGLNDGVLRPGAGETGLVLDAAHRLRVVDGLYTGLHEPEGSHFSLLGAFAPAALLARAYAHAERAGYLCHEFGDSSLILAGATRR